MDHRMFGAVYVIEQDYTREEMVRDFKNMQEMGFTLITLWPVSNPWLASSTHEHVFTKTREVLDLCLAYGMKAILQLFGQNQAQEFMPDSSLTEDMKIRDERGENFNANCFWANLNHPVVRDYMEQYFCQAITSLKDHPAIFGWDVFNEAHFRSDDPWTIALYQKWLKKKYGTIENLNQRWYRRFDSFEQITPEHRNTSYVIWSSILPSFDYEKFRSENLTDICRFLYETAKKYDNEHPIIIDGTSSQITYSELIMRNNDEFRTAEIPDVYGATFYPKSWGRNYRSRPWMQSMYYLIPSSAARKAGKPYAINELQTHTQSALTPGSEVEPQELFQWVWMCVYTAPDVIQLWRYRPFLHGIQSTGRGLTYMDGNPNARGEKMKTAAGILAKYPEYFQNARPEKPAVRMAISYQSRLFVDVFMRFKDCFWPEDVEGWYRLFWRNGLSVEFCDLEKMEETDHHSPVMMLPCILDVSREKVDSLKEYVRRGGILIADARLGTINEFGCVPPEGIPGKELSELFGVREVDVSSGETINFGEGSMPTGFMTQKLAAGDNTEILAVMEDGSPAVVLHHYGEGMTLYVNNMYGLMLRQTEENPLDAVLMCLVGDKLGDRLHAKKPDCVHFAVLESGQYRSLLLINYSREAQHAYIYGIPEGTELTNLMNGTGLRAGKDVVEIELLPDECSVFGWMK